MIEATSHMREIALNYAIGSEGSLGDSTEQIVERAQGYLDFLLGADRNKPGQVSGGQRV